MLITSTFLAHYFICLAHINFSLCVTIPWTIQFVGQMVRLLLRILQNVVQMLPLELQAH